MARDLDDEVRFHLEARITELCARGLSGSEAEAEALQQFGDIEELRRYCGRVDSHHARRVRALEWLDQSARPSAVTRLIVGGGLRLAIGGVLAGFAAAVASTRVLASLLYGVSPFDPLTFLGIGVLIALVALLASYVPARRALRIDPSEALRAE